jgi:glycosyltransferase involved in cell wall biosynthesis
MGEGADRDYAKLGITNWRGWEFCFSVQMPDRPASHRRKDENRPVQILYCGVLEHRKGPDLLVRALSDQSLRCERWILKVVGSGSMAEELSRQVRNAGLSARVRFYGTLGINDTRRILFGEDVLVLPSRFDGWGAVVNEAMSAGLAVVASTQVGAARTMINDGTDGFLFPSGDHVALAKVLRTLIAERTVLAATKERALAKSRLFSPQTAAYRLSELCKALAVGKDPPAWTEGPCRSLGRIVFR